MQQDLCIRGEKIKKSKIYLRDFPGGPVVKNPPSNARDTGLISGQGTKMPHASGQLRPCTTTTELACSGARTLQPEGLRATTKDPACLN